MKNNQKLFSILCHQNVLFFFVYIYKMYLISAEEYKNANVNHLIIRKTGIIWTSMKNAGSDIGVKNISDLVLKVW